MTTLSDSFLEALAVRVAELVLERLRSQPGLGAPLYATPKMNPLGSRKAFLEAARRDDFPSFKRGRSVAAKWADVEQWMRNRTQSSEGKRSLDEELEVATRPRKRRAA